jgi:hypothetical protein
MSYVDLVAGRFQKCFESGTERTRRLRETLRGKDLPPRRGRALDAIQIRLTMIAARVSEYYYYTTLPLTSGLSTLLDLRIVHRILRNHP